MSYVCGRGGGGQDRRPNICLILLIFLHLSALYFMQLSLSFKSRAYRLVTLASQLPPGTLAVYQVLGLQEAATHKTFT